MAASGENIAGIVLFEKQQALKAEIQDLEKLKLSSKHTVNQLSLELTQARAEAENLKRAIEREGSSNTVAAEVSGSRMLHPAPEIRESYGCVHGGASGPSPRDSAYPRSGSGSDGESYGGVHGGT